MENTNSRDSIDKLNELLRGELSAVETYSQALQKIEEPFSAREELQRCHAAHLSRVNLLRQAVINLGGDPAASSGAWGSFAKLVEGTATPLGAKMAIAALEEGEDHGLNEYNEALNDLDAASRALVDRDLLPGQQATHRALSTLKRQMSAA
ncbi:MAG: DUF2383 domain-containing protein [Deltaproteobacteria bacterium]|nr:DUF2383 domain-containing protein [Deltaproteobacteria bacterium]